MAGAAGETDGKRGGAGARPAVGPRGWRRRLGAARMIFRKVALLGPTREEIARMEREDREANTDWLPGGDVGVEHVFLEYGGRRSPEELAEARAEDEADEAAAAHGMRGERTA